MIWISIIILMFISFAVIFYFEKKSKRRKKVKPLSKMNRKEFKTAMEELEIK